MAAVHRVAAVSSHVTASAPSSGEEPWDSFVKCNPLTCSAQKVYELQNFVNGQWRDNKGLAMMELLDPVNGEMFMTMPLTNTDAELKPFLDRMAQIPKSGLHNPLKNVDRYLKYGKLNFSLARELDKPEVADHFTKCIQRVAPKSYAQAMGEVVICKNFLANF